MATPRCSDPTDSSQPDTARIPQSEPDRIYDVRYHTRDTRREFEPAYNGNRYVSSTAGPHTPGP
jgi:hypothetical protein